MQKGLREFIGILEQHGHLRQLSHPVNPLDISAIIARSKAAVMMTVEGFDVPLVGGIVRDRNKVALALSCEPKEIAKRFFGLWSIQLIQ